MRPHATTIPQSKNGRFDPFWRHRSTPVIRYAVAVLLVGAAFLTTVALKDSLHTAYFQTPFFFCAIVLSSWFGGFGSGICSTLLSIVFLKFFFPDPLYNPGFSANELPRFAVFLVTGGFISWLGDRQRRDEVALTHARDNLEEKVHARTLELMKANEKLTAEIAERIRAETERRRAGEALKKTEAELDRVVRVTTMGELTASIAHEVNQPLAAVVTNGNACLRWLAADPPNFDEAHEALRRIIRDGTRAGEVIARIRALVKKDEPVTRRLDCNEILLEIVALTQSEVARRGASLQTDLAANLPAVTGDRVQLQQVLLNLVINALDAMSALTERPRVVRIRANTPEPKTIIVAVEDSGVGLDPRLAARLFDAFYTTKPEGLGMGLSISRSIVEAHGGKLWATSNEGHGATFHFTLPIAEGEET
jgi:C4-dicarboxylate-specific signal transduction histidine kinase